MIQLRVLAVADEESRFIWDYFDRSAFRGVDVIVSCGDLKPAYLTFLTTMVAAPLLYVHGNHDAAMLRTPPEGCDNLEEKMHVVKGVRFLGFGGCNARSPKPLHYTDEEVARQVSRRMQEISRHGGFDVLVTHAPALGLGDGDDPFHQGFRAYRTLLDLFRPAFHFHGHQHPTYGKAKRAIEYNGTMVHNAFGYSVMDLEIPEPASRGRISYIKARYDWGKAYGRQE
ncbi:MAG TPA: metallophosphoesterase family protein [Candidatus Limnocylindria bacterium]|nr:metallophosphoesterase family protein [Candidatus Limnocylindria bacterium]